MSFVKVYIHFVWSTSNREPFLSTRSVRNILWEHIRQNAIQKNIYIDCVNGYTDHCHCLVSMRSDQTVEYVAKMIKGESSFWINHQPDYRKLNTGRFKWQNEYYAISVSESIIPKVREYIYRQEEHHLRKTFKEECKELMKVLEGR